MNLKEAKQAFAVLMATARKRALTAREKEVLSNARQFMRMAARPAMNPRQAKYVVGDLVYVNRSQIAPSLAKDLFWRVFVDRAVIRTIDKKSQRAEIEFPFGKKYWFDFDALEFKNPPRTTSKRADIVEWRKSQKKFRKTYHSSRQGRKTYQVSPQGKANPAPVKIYGRCLRIEAIKTVSHTYGGKTTKAGQHYFHDFTDKNAVIYGLPDGSLLIKSKG